MAFNGPLTYQIDLKKMPFLVYNFTFKTSIDLLDQACQTQTTSRATNSTKTDKRAAKVFKKSLLGQILQNIMIENVFLCVL